MSSSTFGKFKNKFPIINTYFNNSKNNSQNKSNNKFKLLCCFVSGLIGLNSSYALQDDYNDLDLTRRLSAVGTGPYFGLGATYDGFDLVALQPSIHRDLALLRQNQRMGKFTGEVSGPRAPYVQLSGIAEIQFIAESKAKNSVDLTSSNLDIAAWINNWFTAYANFGIEFDEFQKANFRMIQAFITLGNLNVYPFYVTVGQKFVPFGSFMTGTSDMGNLVRNVGRIYQKTLAFGYYPGNGFHITGSVYNGRMNNSKTSNLDQFAGTVEYRTKFKVSDIPGKVTAGVSYTNNLADAARMRNIFQEGVRLHNFVPAVDTYGSITVDKYTARGEYIAATEHFSSHDVLQKGKRIQPRSFAVEFEYADNLFFGKEGWITAHYSEVKDAAIASLIQHQYGINTSITVLKDTLLSFEVSHRKTYSKTNILTNVPTAPNTGLVTAPLDAVAVTSHAGKLNGSERNVGVLTLDLFY